MKSNLFKTEKSKIRSSPCSFRKIQMKRIMDHLSRNTLCFFILK